MVLQLGMVIKHVAFWHLPWLVLACSVMMLSGCGGGGGDQVIRAASPVPAPTAADSASPQAAVSAQVLGTVAVGNPVVGARVTARCLGGVVQAQAVSDIRGGFVINLGDRTAPCLLQAEGGEVAGQAMASPLHGLVTRAGSALVTPFSELVLTRALGQAPVQRFPSFDGRQEVPSVASLNEARQWLADQLEALGLQRPQGHVLAGTLVVGEGDDLVLDALGQRLRAEFAGLQDLQRAALAGQALSQGLQAAAAREADRLQAEAAAREAAAQAEIEADTLRGSASHAGAVVGGQVAVRCRSGTPQSGTSTDAQGRLAVRLYGATLPCLVQVKGGQVDGMPAPSLHAWLDAAASRQVQLSPVSELHAQRVWAQSPADAMQGASMVWPGEASVQAADAWLQAQWQALGLSPGDSASLLALLQSRDVPFSALLPVARQGGSLRAVIEADRVVAIEFEARAGAQPIACGQLIPGLGSSSAAGRLTDFRFYVSEVQLIREDGVLQRLQLGANTAWQYTSPQGDGVTLIDLEDGTDRCADEGTAPRNPWLTGTVPAGRYTGVLMTLGVPEALNHTDTSSAPAPLNSMAMGWGWQAGRKFMKVEVTEAEEGTWPVMSSTFYVHLGSTRCSETAKGSRQFSCGVPNRGLVRLNDFNPQAHKVSVDLVALLAGTDVTRNQPQTSGGCMSQGTDTDCLHVFQALGIGWAADGSGSGLAIGGGLSQSVFQKVDK